MVASRQSRANTNAWPLCQSPCQTSAGTPRLQRHTKNPRQPICAQASATSSTQQTSLSSPCHQRSLGGSRNGTAPTRFWQRAAAKMPSPKASQSQTTAGCKTSSTYQLSATIGAEPGRRSVPGPSHRPFPSWITAHLPTSPVFRVCLHLNRQLPTIPLKNCPLGFLCPIRLPPEA